MERAPDGSFCQVDRTRRLNDGRTSFDDTIGHSLLQPPPPCPPPAPPAEGQPSGPQTPVEMATIFWREVPLPAPQPYIAPGRAITGRPAYLETRGETRHPFAQETPLGHLDLVATGVYYVDWGDGTTTGPHPTEGGPWPDGKITHTYIHVGNYDIVVTEHWTASWALGGASGTLSGLQTVGRIEDFPVEQIQAVIRH